MPLDPLTVADDPEYGEALAAQRNLPPEVAAALRELFAGQGS